MNADAAGMTAEELRRRAEAALVQATSEPPAVAVGIADRQGLVHELQVRQIELELQNEALREMQAETQRALQRYSDLNERLEDIVAARTADLVTARQIAESANVAKSAFLANMSHELRTPMNAIMGMTELATRRASDPKQKDYLGKIMLAAQQLLAIINDILDLSKIEADRLTLERSELRLGDVLSSLDSLIGYQATEKGLALTITCAPDLRELPLLGDPLRLGQVLLNLTGNAVKFTSAGRIDVAAALVKESADQIVVRFDVRDTGVGIPAENLTRLFSAFEQGDNSTTRQYGGTGLGLAISKRLVALMGGSVGVNSSPGVGSHFWFTATLQKGQSVAVHAAALPYAAEAVLSARHRGARILLAEDEPITREVSLGLLEDVGLTVDAVSDGAQAVELARRNSYDLILMDIQMTGMNGIVATRLIRAMPGHERTPILALTANAFAEDRRSCLQAGMNDHIAKPMAPEVFFQTLLKWLPPPST